MKKFFVLILVLAMLATGCTPFDGESIGGLFGGASANLSEEEIYSELDYLIGNPKSTGSSELDGQFTFIAYLIDDAEPITFSEHDEGMYHAACISRRYEDYFFLEVGDIETTFSAGDIVKITGELNGTIYWTEDNAQVDVLDIKASSMESYEPPDITANHSSTIAVDGNGIEFLGAHWTRDSFNDVIVVYFTFTNNGSIDAAPSFSDFYIEYNDEDLSKSMFSLDDVDPSALNAMPVGLTDKTYAGKTQLYYIPLKVTERMDDPGTAVYFTLYDDEFRMTYDFGMLMYDSFEEYKVG